MKLTDAKLRTAFGVYPAVTLKAARDKASEARRVGQISIGADT